MGRLKRRISDQYPIHWQAFGEPPIAAEEEGLVEIVDADAMPAKTAEHLALDAANALAILKSAATSTVDASDSLGLIVRALAIVTLDAVNTIHAAWTDLKTQTAAATTLANFQTRVANNTPNLGQRTKQQLLDAIKTEIAAD